MTPPNKTLGVRRHFFDVSQARLVLCHIHIYMGGPYVAR